MNSDSLCAVLSPEARLDQKAEWLCQNVGI